MTTADRKLTETLDSKRAQLRRRAFRDEYTEYEAHKLIQAAGVSEKASNNGCALFAASISLLAIAAVVVGVIS